MTEEKFKLLAELVLVNNALVNRLGLIVANQIEHTIDSGDGFEGRANSLRHSIEQLQALARDSVAARQKVRADFGLLPEADADDQQETPPGA